MDSQLATLPERINLYLNSSNRTLGATPAKFEMLMETALLTAEVEEIFFINVIQFNTFNNFYQVQKGYNTDFKLLIYNSIGILHDTIIGEIPEGNLTVNDVLEYLQTLFNNLITVEYNKMKNKFVFTKTSNNQNHTYFYLYIINSDAILGFPRSKRNVNITLPHNVPIYSEQPINLISITNFFVHISGDIYLSDENYDNHNSSIIDRNNIIFSMAVDRPYNQSLTYNNIDGGNSFYFRLDNNKSNINRFGLEIRDQFNQPIPQFPEYNMILQFTKKTRVNLFYKSLIEIQTYLNQLYLFLALFFERIGLIPNID